MTAILGFIITLSVLVIVHELGHYAVARMCGVRVIAFSVGFGKVLWKKTDKRGCEWRLSAFPFGGYVMMLDEAQKDKIAELGITEAQFKKEAFEEKSVWRRMAVVAAGPLMNFLLAIVIYAAISMVGTYSPSTKMGIPPEGSQAAAVGVERGWTVESAAGVTTRNYGDLRMALFTGIGKKDVPVVFVTPSGRHEEKYFDFTGIKNDGTEDAAIYAGLYPYGGPVTIRTVDAGSAAAAAGIKPGDIVIEANGIKELDLRLFVTSVREHTGKPIDLVVERAGEKLHLTVTPSETDDPRTGKVGRIGVTLSSEPDLVYTREGIFGGIVKGFADTWRMTYATIDSFGKIATGAISTDSVGGPVMIGSLAGQALEFGWIPFLLFLAVISVNLGILNLLPIPGLDGGHLMFHFYEVAAGRKPGKRVREYGNYAGLAIIAFIMVIALGNDITRLLGNFS